MIGRNSRGGFHTAPTAAYPPGMCRFLATVIFREWLNYIQKLSTCGMGETPAATRVRKLGLSQAFSSVNQLLASSSRRDEVQQQAPGTEPLLSMHEDKLKIITETEIDRASKEADKLGCEIPIKDGLGPDVFKKEEYDMPGELTSDEEREMPGMRRPPKGAGWWGQGPSLRTLRKGVPRDFVDGAGLCSPGRWAVKARVLPSGYLTTKLKNTLKEGLMRSFQKMKAKDPKLDLRRLLLALSKGHYKESPFDEEVVREVRGDLRILCKQGGHGDGLPKACDVVQEFEVRLIQSLLSACGDPDHYFGEWWAKGTWLGSTERKLPRTPAVFDRKIKWAKIEQVDELHSGWQTNYSSIAEHADLVEKQFAQEEAEGLMTGTTVRKALEEYGDTLNIASTGAIDKKDRTDEVRVIYYGSHGLDLNPNIKVRDQVRFPTAADAKCVMTEIGDEGGPHYSIHIDFRKAHRRVPTLREEWGRQACQIKGSAAATAQRELRHLAEAAQQARESKGHRKGQPKQRTKPRISDLPEHVLEEIIWLNIVGTFGVASAGYWWGRAGAAVFRLAHYLIALENALWALLYSDDGWIVGRTSGFEVGLLLFMFLLAVINAPLSWNKMSGGLETDWVGYYLDVRRFQVGISEARAKWCVHWLEDKATEGRMRLGELREGLGRLQFAAGPLEHLRPFLGPLYRWACVGHKYARPKLPLMIVLIMKYISGEMRRSCMSKCATKTRDLGEVFRLDAKAEGNVVAIGGWAQRKARRPRNPSGSHAALIGTMPLGHSIGGRPSGRLPPSNCLVRLSGLWFSCRRIR